MPIALPPRGAPIRSIRPLWRPLGVEATKWGQRYWIEIGSRALGYRAAELAGITFLASVYPDMHYWVRQFPRGANKVDTMAAATYFLRACEAVGEYVPAVSPDTTLTAEPASSTKTSP